jgi:hypothetical protein
MRSPAIGLGEDFAAILVDHHHGAGKLLLLDVTLHRGVEDLQARLGDTVGRIVRDRRMSDGCEHGRALGVGDGDHAAGQGERAETGQKR